MALSACFILLLLTPLISSQDPDDGRNCTAYFATAISPFLCCDLPQAAVRPSDGDCPSKCGNDTDCLYICYIRNAGVFDSDNNFNSEAYEKMFNLYLDHKGIPRELWSEILKESIRKCEEKVKTRRSAAVMNSQVDFSKVVLYCILIDSFLNCPKFNDTSECLEMKNYVEVCDMNGYKL